MNGGKEHAQKVLEEIEKNQAEFKRWIAEDK